MPKPKQKNSAPQLAEIERLERELERLREDLRSGLRVLVVALALVAVAWLFLFV